MNIGRKIKAIDKLQDQIDDQIWKIFKRYIKVKKINFNSPYDWKIEDNSIYFHGSDGCMGCYDNMSCNIPLKYFENPDEEFKLLEKEVEEVEEEKTKSRENQTKKEELRTLNRLKKKYESKK